MLFVGKDTSKKKNYQKQKTLVCFGFCFRDEVVLFED